MEDWSNHIEVAAISDIGMRRSTNQDSYEICMAADMDKWRERGHLFLVADGMGAHAAGELASKLAADGISHLYSKYDDVSPPEALKRAVSETNAEINRRGQANEEFNNMGTTCSVLTLLPYGAVVAHVGDSRVYRVRHDKLEQLTFDHSLVWEMKAAGTLPGGDAGINLIPKNVITRSLGPYPDVNVDMEGPLPVLPGDVFLLCSDGLTGEVEDDEIAFLLSHLEPEKAARVLVDLANLRGGPDNITVIAVKVAGNMLATGNQANQPLKIGKKSGEFQPGPVLYSLLSASVLGAILGGAMANVVMAVLFGVISVALGIYIAVRFAGVASSGKVVAENLRFGKGPYTKTTTASGSKLLSKLEEMGEQLHKAAREDKLPVNLDEFDQYLSQAKNAAIDGNENASVNFFCTGLNNYMDQLRG